MNTPESNERLAIDCRKVAKSYRHFELDEVDLQVPVGTIMGFVGPNGAGKSTTMRILLGLVKADRGQVKVLGHSMPQEQIAAKWEVGYYSEDMGLHPSRSVGFHLQFMSEVFPDWDGDYASQLLERFDIPREQKVKGLSHGQRVKATLLMSLARRPKLLVLDEPTTGLDPIARRQILHELSAVRGDEDRTILFSSHNTDDVAQISDAITCIHRGRIVFSEDREVLLDSWRRIRLAIPDGGDVPPIDGVVSAQQSGRIATVITRAWSDDLPDRLGSAEFRAVDRMTLEEIFMASVPVVGAEPSQPEPLREAS